MSAVDTRRSVTFWIALAAVIVVGVLLVGRPAGDGPPLDPSSTGPLGTRGLVLLVERLGGRVDVTDGAPGPEHDVVLVLGDDLDDGGRDAVRRWVTAGGTLVVTDPRSPLNPFPTTGRAAPAFLEDTLSDRCGIAALRDVERIDAAGGVTYGLFAGARGCFRAGGGAFVAVTDQGDGTVVAIGGAGAFVNDRIGQADNAVLAAALLVPRPGTRVAFLRPPPPGAGDAGLADLVGDNVKQAVVQLGVAFLLYALWRGRRLGRPVTEPQPVELAASELVVAVGHLLQQAGRRQEAGRLLRDDLRRHLAARFGIPPSADPAEVAEIVAARTAIPTERLRAVLDSSPLRGDDDLVALAAAADALRADVAGRAPSSHQEVSHA